MQAQARRSDFASRDAVGAARRPVARARGGIDGNGALRSARGMNNENTHPNMDIATKGRRSPRLGACSAMNSNNSTNSRGLHTTALADITNVTEFKAPVWSSRANELKPKRSVLAVSTVIEVQPAEQQPVASADVTMEGDSHKVAQESNTQTLEEYAPCILNQLFLDETTYLPQSDYMDSQTDITGKMRTILIDWLVEVHMKYKLLPETLHLTVNLIDRYIAKAPVNRKRLQLVGVVAMFIASKYEEVRPPELHDWVYICDMAYTKKDVLHMECTMLSTLSFHIMVPTAAHFFEPLQKANGCTEVHREVAQYLLELGLLDLRMLQHTPSHVVAAALLLSNELLKRATLWPAAMVQQSRHTEQAVRSCAEDLRQLLEADHAGAGGQLQAIHKKFSLPQRHTVAKMKF